MSGEPEFQSTRLLFALALPMFLTYLLLAIRFLERSKGSYLILLPSIRDAALVTLALDLAELGPSLRSPLLDERSKFTLAVVIVLLVFHGSALVLAGYSKSRGQASDRPVGWQMFTGLYIGFILLFTNAVTILEIIARLGRFR